MKQNWGILLHYIYTHENDWKYYKDGIHTDHDFMQEVDLEEEEVHTAFEFLVKHELIEIDYEDGGGGEGAISLSKKGFEVAREREVQRNNYDINRATVFLSIFAAIASVPSIYNFITRFVSWPVSLVAFLVVVVVLGVLIRRFVL